MTDKKDIATNRLLDLLRGNTGEDRASESDNKPDEKLPEEKTPSDADLSPEEEKNLQTKSADQTEPSVNDEAQTASSDETESNSHTAETSPDIVSDDVSDNPEEDLEDLLEYLIDEESEFSDDKEAKIAGADALHSDDDEASEDPTDYILNEQFDFSMGEMAPGDFEELPEDPVSPGPESAKNENVETDALSSELILEDIGTEIPEKDDQSQPDISDKEDEPEEDAGLELEASDERYFQNSDDEISKPLEDEIDIDFSLETEEQIYHRIEKSPPAAVQSAGSETAYPETMPAGKLSSEEDDHGSVIDDDVQEENNSPFAIREWIAWLRNDFLQGMLPMTRKTIGIDIGEYAVKYIEISGGNSPVLEQVEYHVIPEEYRENAVQRKKYVSEILNQLLQKTGKNPQICVTGSTSELSIRNIKMPKVSRKELHEAVMWSSKKSLPFDIDEAMLDYTVLGETKESGIDKLDVLLIAARREEIDLQIAFLDSLEIVPERLTLDPLAIWSVLRQFPHLHTEGSVMVVELGEKSSYINFFNDQVLRFVREISIAGKDFTAALSGNISTKAGRIHVDRQRANQIKMEIGIPEDGLEGYTEEGISLQQISTSLREPLERMIQEIQRSLEYYKKEMSYSTVEKIYLTGGSAKLKHLVTYLSQHLKASWEDGVEIEILDPLDYMEIGERITNPDRLQDISTSLTGTIGLVSPKHPDLNLLPERLKLLPRQAKAKSVTIMAAMVAVLIMLGSSAYLMLKNNYLEQELETIKQSYARIAPQEQRYQAAVKTQNQVVKQLQDLRDQIQIETLDSRPLKLLSNMVPANFALDEVDVQIGDNRQQLNLTVSGNIYGNVTDSEIDLIEFYQNLMGTDYFGDVRLDEKKKLQMANTSGLFFKMSMVVL